MIGSQNTDNLIRAEKIRAMSYSDLGNISLEEYDEEHAELILEMYSKWREFSCNEFIEHVRNNLVLDCFSKLGDILIRGFWPDEMACSMYGGVHQNLTITIHSLQEIRIEFINDSYDPFKKHLLKYSCGFTKISVGSIILEDSDSDWIYEKKSGIWQKIDKTFPEYATKKIKDCLNVIKSGSIRKGLRLWM